MLAGVAPVAPAAGEALAGLFLILAFVICIGLQKAWVSTLGWLFLKLAELFDAVSFTVLRVTVRPLGSVAKALRAISHNVEQALGAVALKSEAGAVWLFTQMWHQLQWMGREIADLARDTNTALTHVSVGVSLAVVKRMTATLGRQIDTLRGIEHGLEARTKAALARLRVGIDRIEHFATRTLPKTISGVRARVTHAERDITRLRKRVKALEHARATKAFAALVATALGILGLSWLRCPSVVRAMKRRPCIDFDYLDALLTGALLIVGTISLREFAKEVGSVTEEASDLIHGFIRDA